MKDLKIITTHYKPPHVKRMSDIVPPCVSAEERYYEFIYKICGISRGELSVILGGATLEKWMDEYFTQLVKQQQKEVLKPAILNWDGGGRNSGFIYTTSGNSSSRTLELHQKVLSDIVLPDGTLKGKDELKDQMTHGKLVAFMIPAIISWLARNNGPLNPVFYHIYFAIPRVCGIKIEKYTLKGKKWAEVILLQENCGVPIPKFIQNEKENGRSGTFSAIEIAEIVLNISFAIHSLFYNFGVMHNDVHTKQILIKSIKGDVGNRIIHNIRGMEYSIRNYVAKLIDFGNATMKIGDKFYGIGKGAVNSDIYDALVDLFTYLKCHDCEKEEDKKLYKHFKATLKKSARLYDLDTVFRNVVEHPFMRILTRP